MVFDSYLYIISYQIELKVYTVTHTRDYCQAQPQLQLSWAEMVFNVNLTPPTQPGKYQASKIKQFMLNGSCQSLGVKLKTVFGPNLNNLNSSLKAIIDSKNGKLKIQ